MKSVFIDFKIVYKIIFKILNINDINCVKNSYF